MQPHKYKEVKIHSTAVIEGDVEIGEGTEIGAFCYLKGPLVIGKYNKIYTHVVMGEGPEHRTKPIPVGPIIIGDCNHFREFCVVQRGTGDRITQIGNDCYFMDHVHLAHDCLIRDSVNIAPNTVLAGHVIIDSFSNISLNVSIHQFSTIGAYSMVGMGGVVTKDIPPFTVVSGNPCQFLKLNEHHFEKLGLSKKDFIEDQDLLKTNNPKLQPFFEYFYGQSRRKKFLRVTLNSIYT